MKEKIKSELKNKYANLGLSDQQIDGVASFLGYSVNSEDGIDAAVASVEPLLKSMQSENDRARTASKQYTDKINELENKIKGMESKGSDDDDKKKKEKGNETPEYIKTMMEQMAALTKTVTDMKGERRAAERKAEISTIIKDLPESVKAIYSRMDVNSYDEAKFAELKQKVANEASLIVKEINQRGFKPPFGHSGDDNNAKASDKEIKDAMKFMPKMF